MITTFSGKALKNLAHLPDNEKSKVLRKIEYLKNNPLAGKKLQGEYLGFFAFRAWPYRIIYTFEKPKEALNIFDIRHRQGAY